MNNITNSSYLRTTRDFPIMAKELSVELNKAYVDIANTINARTIGIFTVNRSAVTGEQYFINNNQKQQGLRQVYNFTATGNIPHGLNLDTITNFTNCFGSFTDGTNDYGVIFGSNTAIAGQISFYITANNIVVLAGAGAPAITSGIIVLQWISEP